MKPVVFFSAPRTRSTVLFEALAPFVEKTTGQRRIKGHTELFLEFSRNMVCHDKKSGIETFGELFPIVDKNLDINIHFIHPPVFQDTRDRNAYKLEVLQMQRAKDIEHFVKCTLEIVDSLPAVLEFYRDYKIVITKRRDLVQYCLSNLAARLTGLYHARADNVDVYTRIVHGNPIMVDLEQTEGWLGELLWYTGQLWKVDNHADATVVWYEEMDTDYGIRAVACEITGETKSVDLSKGNLPIKLDNKYDQIFANYDPLLLVIDRAINKVSNGLF